MTKITTPLDRMRADREASETKYTIAEMTEDKLHVDVFDTEAGREWMRQQELRLLHGQTPLDLSDGALRGLEHTRNFLRRIRSRIERFHKHGGTAKG